MSSDSETTNLSRRISQRSETETESDTFNLPETEKLPQLDQFDPNFEELHDDPEGLILYFSMKIGQGIHNIPALLSVILKFFFRILSHSTKFCLTKSLVIDCWILYRVCVILKPVLLSIYYAKSRISINFPIFRLRHLPSINQTVISHNFNSLSNSPYKIK